MKIWCELCRDGDQTIYPAGTEAVGVEVEIFNNQRIVGAVSPFRLVVEKAGLKGASGAAGFAVFFLAGKANHTRTETGAKADGFPGGALALAPGEGRRSAADLVSEGENFGAGKGYVFHYLTSFDYDANIACFIFKCKHSMFFYQTLTFEHAFSGIFAGMKSKPYQERKAEKRYSVLVANCQVIGVWGNLKKLSEDMQAEDPEFISYSSLSKRRAEENPIKFTTEKGEYAVHIETLR